MRPAETYSGQLRRFLWEVLWPVVPRVAWLVLGLTVFSWLNLVFLEELWPHYPLAETWFTGLLVGCLVLLLWLGAYTVRQVSRHVRRWWWRALWQLVTIGAYGVAGLWSVLIAIGVLGLLMN